MEDHFAFIKAFVKPGRTSNVDRAIALLWFFSRENRFTDYTAGELGGILKSSGLSRPNSTELKCQLKKSKYTIKGERQNSFRINIAAEDELNQKFQNLLANPILPESHSILPLGLVPQKREYLNSFVKQINGCYDYGFFDGSAVLMRRLMESLIIEIYIFQGRQNEIKNNKRFFGLEALIKKITNEKNITLSSDAEGTMNKIKELGDTAAHHRVHLTKKADIDDSKLCYRKLISELLSLSGIKT